MDEQQRVLRGRGAAIPTRRGRVLRFNFPVLRLSNDFLAITGGVLRWNWGVPRSEVKELVLNSRSVLIRRTDGTSGLFVYGRRRLPDLKQALTESGWLYRESTDPLRYMVIGEPTRPKTIE